MGLPQSNYTQVPNEILERLDELKCSELKIILAICRQTIGYHREHKRLSLEDLIKATGLSRPSIIAASRALAEFGWIKRIPSQDSFEYALELEDSPRTKSTKANKKGVKKVDPRGKNCLPEGVKKVDPRGKNCLPEGVKKVDPLFINKDLNKDLNKACKESAREEIEICDREFPDPESEPSKSITPDYSTPPSPNFATEQQAPKETNLPARRGETQNFDNRLTSGDLLDSLMADGPVGEVHPAAAMEARFRAGADGYPWKRDRAMLSGFLEYLVNTYSRIGESKERSRNIAVRMVDKANYAPIQSQEYQRVYQSWLLFLENAKRARTVGEATGQFSRLTPYAQEMRAKRQREREERSRAREAQQAC